jgi:hypothetical protein
MPELPIFRGYVLLRWPSVGPDFVSLYRHKEHLPDGSLYSLEVSA